MCVLCAGNKPQWETSEGMPQQALVQLSGPTGACPAHSPALAPAPTRQQRLGWSQIAELRS
jgi:hypothetical protein